MTTEPVDECATLRRDLALGRWKELVHPLLEFALMQDMGPWWPQALASCAAVIRSQMRPATSVQGLSEADRAHVRRLAHFGAHGESVHELVAVNRQLLLLSPGFGSPLLAQAHAVCERYLAPPLQVGTPDEVAMLKTALGSGAWNELLSPLLLTTVVADPSDWWWEAAKACADSMLRAIVPDRDWKDRAYWPEKKPGDQAYANAVAAKKHVTDAWCSQRSECPYPPNLDLALIMLQRYVPDPYGRGT